MPTKYIKFTDEQRGKARNTDLAEFLRLQGETLKRSGSEYEWGEGSEKITIRGNLWYSHYEGEGGDAVDFVRKFYDKNYPEAIEYLLSEEIGVVKAAGISPNKQKEFELPKGSGNMQRVFDYLVSKRGMDMDIVKAFVREGMIYEEEKYHNSVFVGYDKDGNPRHAHKRGIGTENFKRNAPGSMPEYSFHWHGISGKLYFFEAPIDMLSFISMNKNGWQNNSYGAACSVSDKALFQMLKDNKDINKVYICFDNDLAGQTAANRISEKLSEYGINSEILVPINKDWNEDILFCEDEEGEELCQELKL